MYALCICTCICICICICVCISISICICVCIGICICIPPCLRFAGSELCGPPAKPVLARRLKCRCRLPASFLPLLVNCIVHCKMYFRISACIFFLSFTCVFVIVFVFLCYFVCQSIVACSGQLPCAGARARPLLPPLVGKTRHTFEFRPKNWVAVLLQVGRSRGFQDLQHWLWQHRHGYRFLVDEFGVRAEVAVGDGGTGW